MIKFKKILDGMTYRKNCPVCHSPLHVNDQDLAEPFSFKKKKISFPLLGDDVLVVNLFSEDIDLKLKQSVFAMGYYNYNGIAYGRVQCECVSCCLYYFVLQVQINMSIKKIENILLNSEFLAFEDASGFLHEINNIYSLDKCEYKYYNIEGDSKKLDFPIVELDFANPKQTIDKLQKLIIFS